ncbi:MAG: hypothetical protein IPP40_00710 [bacterium]|nr:hypothetical protein [bacterium]
MTKNESSLLIWLVIGIDLLIVVLNVFPTGNGGVDHYMSLDDESNFVTWYSSSKLLVTALLCVIVARLQDSFRWTFRFTGIALLGISMSETSMFHERLSAAIYTIRTGEVVLTGGKGIWVIYLAPVCLIVLLVLARVAQKVSKEFSVIRWPMISTVFLWTVVLIAETAPRWATPMTEASLRTAMIIEESCELFGATTLLIGLLAVIREISNSRLVIQEAV